MAFREKGLQLEKFERKEIASQQAERCERAVKLRIPGPGKIGYEITTEHGPSWRASCSLRRRFLRSRGPAFLIALQRAIGV
jgi:hypothetical protein